MESSGACSFFGEEDEGGSSDQQHEESYLYAGECDSLKGGHLVGPLEGVASVEHEYAAEDAAEEAGQAYEGVEVAACEAKDHP